MHKESIEPARENQQEVMWNETTHWWKFMETPVNKPAGYYIYREREQMQVTGAQEELSVLLYEDTCEVKGITTCSTGVIFLSLGCPKNRSFSCLIFLCPMWAVLCYCPWGSNGHSPAISSLYFRWREGNLWRTFACPPLLPHQTGLNVGCMNMGREMSSCQGFL